MSLVLELYCKDVQLVGGPYVAKDQRKLDLASHYVCHGSTASSSRKYWDQLVGRYELNVSEVDVSEVEYTSNCALYVSVEGARRGRLAYSPASSAGQAVDHFLSIGGVVIADNEYDRHRSYNVGERELEAHLLSRGAIEFKPGMWHVRPALSKDEASAIRRLIIGYIAEGKTSGFCDFARAKGTSQHSFDWAMREWPKSASLKFPVPDPERVVLSRFAQENCEKARLAYVRAVRDGMFEGEYGALRREMLGFVYERLELAVK